MGVGAGDTHMRMEKEEDQGEQEEHAGLHHHITQRKGKGRTRANGERATDTGQQATGQQAKEKMQCRRKQVTEYG